MARRGPAASETLEEIQSAADRMAEWIGKHVVLVAGSVLALLALVGIVSFVSASRGRQEDAAATALAETRTAYLMAMGAGPDSLEVPELASEEAARRIRAEYSERFEAVADEHPGTVAGAMALMEVAQLAIDAGEHERALKILDRALAEGVGGDRLRGVLLQREAGALEDLGRWKEAAERHEQAADLRDFPLRYWALADAARCLRLAGDRDGARALYERLQAEAPELRLPDSERAAMRELLATGKAEGPDLDGPAEAPSSS